MPISVADAWAAVYIGVSAKLEGAKGGCEAGDRSPGGEGDENPVTTEDP